MKKNYKDTFIQGPIPATFIAESISNHQTKTGIGAHDIFLGQVRADISNGKKVASIEYTAYEEMALEKMSEIREDTFSRFQLSCLHVYHSLGIVPAGEICLFVMVSSPHRKDAFEATKYLVERLKKEVPVFGKEYFEDQTHQWKVNT